MMENFSTGTRGSLLAEEILIGEFPLIFFYRENTYLPFLAGVSINTAVIS
jgi:hypothetical protein